MSRTSFEIRRGAYYDSVVLMQLQRALVELDQVIDAGVVMATPANLELLQQNDLLPSDIKAAPEDLLIVVRAGNVEDAAQALSQVDALLARRRAAVDAEFRPHGLESAAKMLPEATWVLVSVPGRYAAQVASQALELDRHVFLYSDNVSLADEVRLKQDAAEKGLIVMGPDCGTAMVNGVGLGFANRVRRGRIGLVGASGTGLQAVTARIHQLGGGVSHALGTGGRDLKTEVGGRTTLQCLDLLNRDPDTGVIVLISKPPDPGVSRRVLSSAYTLGKPTVVHFIGYAAPGRKLGNLIFANSLSEAALIALDLDRENAVPFSTKRAGRDGPAPTAVTEMGRRYLRGLFSGGTLASEAMRCLGVFLDPLFANLTSDSAAKLPDSLVSQAHTILDLGEDEFTVGRLHPMIDNDLRIRRFRQEAADPEVAIILLDIVLGEGAHPDPAAEWTPVVEEMRQTHGIEVPILLIGTQDDPQGLESQRERLEGAGARVFEDTASAAEFIFQHLGVGYEPKVKSIPLDAFTSPLAAINVGLESFYESLLSQGAQAVQMDWRPPAGGDDRLSAILEKMRTKT
ncbi:MAG TPA: acyl-CoA synthetase FdrA [Anaerolineales bacterium]|nr:acyl-CoA synthetase FdrA [Anaerolineales bacterium]